MYLLLYFSTNFLIDYLEYTSSGPKPNFFKLSIFFKTNGEGSWLAAQELSMMRTEDKVYLQNNACSYTLSTCLLYI